MSSASRAWQLFVACLLASSAWFGQLLEEAAGVNGVENTTQAAHLQGPT